MEKTIPLIALLVSLTNAFASVHPKIADEVEKYTNAEGRKYLRK